MFEIMTVCTGNICRSPLAEQLLRQRLDGLPVRVTSAGTYGLDAAPMPPEAQRLASQLGVATDLVAAHRSRALTEMQLREPSLLLAMSREHRTRIVQLAPAKLRAAFTLREFARLAADTDDDEILTAATDAGADPTARMRAAVSTVAAHRGLAVPPDSPEDDDIIDPYRRSWQTYELSGAQLAPAIDGVVRVVTLAVSPS